MPVIVISGHGTIETAVSAIKMGAYDYLEKPFTHDKLMVVLKRACEAAKLKRENIDLKSKVIDKTEFVGNAAITAKLRGEIEKVAPTSGRVMIHGAVGSGKELAARLIHKKSKRANGPFIVFSPTSMNLNKVQYELFGESERQEANANLFDKRASVLEAANNGTLYIDEIGDLPIIAQNKLLKFAGKKFEKTYLVSTGSEATEAALKLMRMNGQKIKKRKLGIISFECNWHGRTMGAQMMSGNLEQKKWIGYEDKNIHHLKFPYPWDCEEKDAEEFFNKNIHKIIKNKNINPKKDICGCIVETAKCAAVAEKVSCTMTCTYKKREGKKKGVWLRTRTRSWPHRIQVSLPVR